MPFSYTELNFKASGTQQIISMGRTATQSNVVSQIQDYTSVQKIAPYDNTVQRNQTQEYAETPVVHRQNQLCVQSRGFLWTISTKSPHRIVLKTISNR